MSARLRKACSIIFSQKKKSDNKVDISDKKSSNKNQENFEDEDEILPARPSMAIHEYKKTRRCRGNQFKKEIELKLRLCILLLRQVLLLLL